MTLELLPALERSAAELSAIFARAFEGYFVPIPDDPAAFERRVAGEAIDLGASRLALVDGDVAGLILVARRGEVSRIAGLGVNAPWRRHGIGRALSQAAVDDARARGDRRVLLEVIERNTAAVELYRGLGFEVRRRLVGYAAETSSPGADALDEVEPSEVASAVAEHGAPDLPWQLAADSVGAAAPPARALTLLGRAYALVGPPGVLRALVVPRPFRRRGWGTRLLAALPAGAWTIPPIVPEGLAAEFLARAGFARQALTQLELELTRR
jgi:ribosomal protein S18 acetylase RimI-like enzyme